MQEYLSGIWSKFVEKIDLRVVIVAALVIVCLLLFSFLWKKRTGKVLSPTKYLTYGAICIALSYVLSFIRLWRMPNGGSITPASMLPLMAYGYMVGPLWGTVAGIVYSLLQMTQGVDFLSPAQFVFDYVLPFIVLGVLPGVFSTKKATLNIYLGFILAILARYLSHFIAGFVFWGEYAPYNPVLYSLVYNSFVLIDGIPCLILMAVPAIRALFKRVPQKSKKA